MHATEWIYGMFTLGIAWQLSVTDIESLALLSWQLDPPGNPCLNPDPLLAILGLQLDPAAYRLWVGLQSLGRPE
jgi:hypothetical protein